MDGAEQGGRRWHLAVTRHDGYTAITAGGEVDIATAPQLTATLDAAIHGSGPGGRVIVDLSAVTFFGSAGVTALIQARALAAETGASLRIVVGAPRFVTRPLQISGADKVLDLYATTEEAVR